MTTTAYNQTKPQPESNIVDTSYRRVKKIQNIQQNASDTAQLPVIHTFQPPFGSNVSCVTKNKFDKVFLIATFGFGRPKTKDVLHTETNYLRPNQCEIASR